MKKIILLCMVFCLIFTTAIANEADLLAQLNLIETRDGLLTFLHENSSSLGIQLTDFDNLSLSQKNTVLMSIVDYHFTTVKEFQYIFATRVTGAKNSTPPKSSGGSGGGNGAYWYLDTIFITETGLVQDENQQCRFHFNIDNDLTEAVEADVFLQIYNNNDNTCKIIKSDLSIQPDVPQDVYIDLPNIAQGEYTIKTLVWDKNLSPLAKFLDIITIA